MSYVFWFLQNFFSLFTPSAPDFAHYSSQRALPLPAAQSENAVLSQSLKDFLQASAQHPDSAHPDSIHPVGDNAYAAIITLIGVPQLKKNSKNGCPFFFTNSVVGRIICIRQKEGLEYWLLNTDPGQTRS